MDLRVNPSLARELAGLLGEPIPRDKLVYEEALIVAARTLSRAAAYEMTATTVVGVLGHDDIDAFRALVDTLAQDFCLQATPKLKMGSFSVRFSRVDGDGLGESA
jgi:hypothetical protein